MLRGRRMRPKKQKVVSEATRRRHAKLSRERQGPDGRWESNKKKAAARLARRKSHRLDPLFQCWQEQQATAQAKALDEALNHVQELLKVTDCSSLMGVIRDLERLEVTAKILQRTMLPKVLQEAVQRFPAAKAAGQGLRLRWRDAYRQDLAKARDARTCPSSVVARAAAAGAAATQAPAPAAAAVTPTRRPGVAGCAGLAPGAATKRRRLSRAESVASKSPAPAGGGSESSSSSSSSSDDDEGGGVAGRAGDAAAQADVAVTPESQTSRAKAALGASATPPQGKPSRKPPRQQRLTTFFKAPRK